MVYQETASDINIKYGDCYAGYLINNNYYPSVITNISDNIEEKKDPLLYLSFIKLYGDYYLEEYGDLFPARSKTVLPYSSKKLFLDIPEETYTNIHYGKRSYYVGIRIPKGSPYKYRRGLTDQHIFFSGNRSNVPIYPFNSFNVPPNIRESFAGIKNSLKKIFIPFEQDVNYEDTVFNLYHHVLHPLSLSPFISISKIMNDHFTSHAWNTRWSFVKNLLVPYLLLVERAGKIIGFYDTKRDLAFLPENLDFLKEELNEFGINTRII